MAYQFITIGDLKAYTQAVFLDTSQADFTTASEQIEKDNIALIKSKLGTRYDTEEIFEQTGEDRSRIIVKVLSVLVTFDLIRRNAARKVPDDFRQDWEWAMKWLDAVRDGKESPQELPIIDPEAGNNLSEVPYGNNANENYRL